MTENVAFLFEAADLEVVDTQNYKLFPLTERAMAGTIKKGWDYFDFQDYYDKSKAENISALATKWANSWSSSRNKVLSYFNLSLDHYFAKRLYLFECINNVIDKEKPTKVFVGRGSGDEYEVASFLSNKKGVTVEVRNHRWVFSFFLILYWLIKLPAIKNYDLDRFKVTNGVHFVLASNYHILDLMSLLRKIPAGGVLVIGRIEQAKSELAGNKIPNIDFNGQIRIRDIPFFIFLKLKYLLVSKSIRRNIYLYNGFDLYPLFSRRIWSILLYEVLDIESHRLFFNELLKKIRPKNVLAITNDARNQALLDLAKSKKISTYEIQHGLSFGHDIYYQIAKIFMVWGEGFKKMNKNENRFKSDILVCGWPALDALHFHTDTAPLVRKKIVTILFLNHIPEGFSAPKTLRSNLKAIGEVYKAVNNLTKVRLNVRLHPRTPHYAAKALAKSYKYSISFDQEKRLTKSIQNADIIIGQTTTATIIGLASGKPLIYFPSMDWHNNFLKEKGVAFYAKNSTDIQNALTAIIKGKKQDKKSAVRFLTKYCSNGLKSSKKLLEILNDE